MKITINALWFAVFRLFANAQIGCGNTLPLKELMTAWAQTGLRQSDLAKALETLSLAGYIRLENAFEGPVARLLDERFGFLRPGSDDHRSLQALDSIRHQRKRSASHIATLLPQERDGRRREDHSVCTAVAA